MPTFDMRSYARRGAETRIEELKQELEAIYGAFPELREGSSARRRGRPAGKVVVNHEEQATGAGSRRRSAASAGQPGSGARKRRKMTAAQRKAVGERMRKYWAARKAEAGAKKR